MSGDVQPRKRKDKKKKKDDLGVEEPRGTAAALGEGDVFIHSYQEHGTGGHWCAKIIFFSLLAVLITLIGLIILENRGLTELEANSVESKYSGVLEGWMEETPEDDHYDEQTLDLKHPEEEDLPDGESHHDSDEEDDEQEVVEDNEKDNDEEEDTYDSNEEHNNEDDSDEDGNIEGNLEESEEFNEKTLYRRYNYEEKYKKINNEDYEDDGEEDDESGEDNYEDGDNDDEDGEDDDDEDDDYNKDEVTKRNEDSIDNLSDEDEDGANMASDELDDEQEDGFKSKHDEDNNYEANDYLEKEDSHPDDNNIEDKLQEENSQVDDDDEIEKIEADRSDWQKHGEVSTEKSSEKQEKDASVEDDDYENFQEEDEDDEPPIERITTPPAGKPFVEVEEVTIVKPVDTLAQEAEYERRQEELRKEKEEHGSQGIWLKVAVGGALLLATHAVLHRATARDAPESEERTREATPSVVDRRMTLIPDAPSTVAPQTSARTSLPIDDNVVFKKPAPVFKNIPLVKTNIEEEIKEKIILQAERSPVKKEQYENDDEEKELYSDEEEIIEEEEEEEEPAKIQYQPKAQVIEKEESEPEDEPEGIEIIEDEQIEEEEEDVDEEEISDVDDAELLSRLEAKYGRLPEPERFGKQKDGGNSVEDQWPGEPSDAHWREQLDIAENELRQGALASCEKRVSEPNLADSGRARWILAKVLDASADVNRDNKLLSKAISAYLNLLKMNERLSDKKLIDVAERAIDRIQFRGTYLNAEPIYRLLIRRFPQDINYRNNLTISFLMANRADLADQVLRETLHLWPNDRVALAHHGFVLKTQYNKLEEAVLALQKALEGDTGPACEPRFYYHLGDALLLLGRSEEAHRVHERGAALGHFLSPAQRSLYNVPRLEARPWWPVEDTPYVNLARTLERSWREILKEAEAAKASFEQEKEGLKEKGEWSQLELFMRGREVPGRCARAPVTCAAVRAEAAAAGCRRGQVKFSAMRAGTRVRAHVGPTNCRLRMHLGLSNTDNTFIRVDKEIRQWQVGKTLIFDDSFEHEVWHNGTGTRLVLIVDVWHPQLTARERRQLPAI